MGLLLELWKGVLRRISESAPIDGDNITTAKTKKGTEIHYSGPLPVDPVKIRQVFQAGINPDNAAQIDVGFARDETGYPLKDFIYLYDDSTQKMIAIDKSASAENATATGAGYFYYRVTQDGAEGGAAVLAFSTTFPPSPVAYNEQYLLICTVGWDTDHITNVKQHLKSNPILWTRPILPEFTGFYFNDGSIPTLRVLGGTAAYANVTQTISAASYALGS
ncbi:MAG: hypothetical protein ACTSX8_08525, partial [Alphaproteobacteria bacterium]